MKPTLIAGDTLFVAKWPFLLDHPRTPQRGDVVTFSEAPNRKMQTATSIKRILGLPGDSIGIKNGYTILNGKELTRTPTPMESCPQETLPGGATYQICLESPVMDDFGPEQVPDGHVFMSGDLRSQPEIVGGNKNRKIASFVPLNAIKGKALWIGLSIGSGKKTNSSFLKIPNFGMPNFNFDRMFRRIQ